MNTYSVHLIVVSMLLSVVLVSAGNKMYADKNTSKQNIELKKKLNSLKEYNSYPIGIKK